MEISLFSSGIWRRNLFIFYILFAITFGFHMMQHAEVALGRKTGRGVVGTFQSLDKRFTFMG